MRRVVGLLVVKTDGSLRTVFSRAAISVLPGLFAALLLCGCDARSPAAPGGSLSGGRGEEVEEVLVALSAVPSGVQCVRVQAAVAANPPVVVAAPVTSGMSFILSLGRLPAGDALFTADAFTFACSAVSATTSPDWVADPVTATLLPGVATTVELFFRRNNPVTADITFLD